jgi:plasmid replication initiation protein
METDLIAKQANKLIESVYRMEVEEQKVILLATKKVNDIELRGLPFTPETEIVITADDFVRAYGVNKQRAFEALVSAKNTIYDRSFEIDYVDVNGETKPISSRWIHAKGEMKHKSAISMFFTPAVIPFIYLVVKEEFTLIDLREVGRLKSKYAVRLYQLLMKWRNANYQPIFTIEVLRKKLGLAETEYLQFGDFNKRVIQVAVDQINKGTGFTALKAIPKKEGRKVVSFRFEYKEYDNKTINVTPLIKKKPKQSEEALSDGFVIHQMTDDQIKMFSSSLAVNASKGEPGYSELGKLVIAGQKTEVLAERIAGDFRKRLFAPYLDVLKLAGFTPNKFNKTPVVGSTGENTPTDSGVESNESEETTQKPFKLPDSLYAKYVAKGGKLTRDQILEVAMAENVKPVRVMLDNGINVLAT